MIEEEIVASASKPDSGERTDATESTSTIDVMDTSQPQKDVDSIIPDVQASTEHSHSDPSVTPDQSRSEEHTSELQSPVPISYAVFCLKKKNIHNNHNTTNHHEREQMI